jgi:hypothetical protein
MKIGDFQVMDAWIVSDLISRADWMEARASRMGTVKHAWMASITIKRADRIEARA